MKPEKLNISVLIENDQKYDDTYVSKQKLKVIVNKTVDELDIDPEGRILRREDGTKLPDLDQTIEEAGIYDGEVLRFINKADKPVNRDQRFA